MSGSVGGVPVAGDGTEAPTWRDAERLIYEEISRHPGLDAQGLADHIADMLLSNDLLADVRSMLNAESREIAVLPPVAGDLEAERRVTELIGWMRMISAPNRSGELSIGREDAAALVAEFDRRAQEIDSLRRLNDTLQRYVDRGTDEIERLRGDLAEHNRMHEIAVDDLAVRVMELSGLLRGMARRVVERRAYIGALCSEYDDMRAELRRVRSEWDASDRRVAAVRALADAEIDNRGECSCAGAPDFGGGVYGSHEGDCATNDPPLVDARAVLAVLDGSTNTPRDDGCRCTWTTPEADRCSGCNEAMAIGSPDTPREPDADELLLVRKSGRMSGRPTVGHSRLPLTTLLEFLRAGDAPELVQSAYPSVTREQMRVVAALSLDLADDRVDLPVSPREDETPEPAATRVMYLSAVEDWEALAAQVGGHVRTERDISDEYVSELVIPGVSGAPVRLRESDALLIIDQSAGGVSTTPDPTWETDETRSEWAVKLTPDEPRPQITGFRTESAARLGAQSWRETRAIGNPVVVSRIVQHRASAWTSAAALAGTATTPQPAQTQPGHGARWGLPWGSGGHGNAAPDDYVPPPKGTWVDDLTESPAALLGTWADPEFRAHQDHRHPVEGCGYCPPEDET